jgi:exosortase J
MFTPTFGMFIAPGCNGIRGSVTMGFIALIAGYAYRFRWTTSALVVVGAILLGYVFNLARLCSLVLYYIVALHFPSLQNKAEMADYLIGAALFLVATFLLFTVIHRFRNAGNPDALDAASDPHGDEVPDPPPAQYWRFAAMLGMVLVGGVGIARSASTAPATAETAAEEAAARFPQTLGTYTLVRSWTETAPVGPIIYVWAQYASGNGGAPISLGVSPVLGSDSPLICHLIRGEQPAWQGPLTMITFGAAPINFSSALYVDGVTQSLEATTLCTSGVCGEFANQPTHFGFVYVRPDSKYLFNPDPRRPIPVVVRAETNDMTLSAQAARQQLTEELRAFLASVRLDDLTQPYSR